MKTTILNLNKNSYLGYKFKSSNAWDYFYDSPTGKYVSDEICHEFVDLCFPAFFGFNQYEAYLFNITTPGERFIPQIKFKINFDDLIFDVDGEIEKVSGCVENIFTLCTKIDIDDEFCFYFNNKLPIPPLNIKNEPYALLEIHNERFGFKQISQYKFDDFIGIHVISIREEFPSIL